MPNVSKPIGFSKAMSWGPQQKEKVEEIMRDEEGEPEDTGNFVGFHYRRSQNWGVLGSAHGVWTNILLS